MESILCVDIPVQMISCAANFHGASRTFRLRYSYFTHEWRLSRLPV
ncbi:MAG: hypothetical protein J6A08_07660 [Lachnospiraceae bacterium]|nr:hypothetical protein [Lachnospiraceae bacterium]